MAAAEQTISIEEFRKIQAQLLELKHINYALEERCVKLQSSQEQQAGFAGQAGRFFNRIGSGVRRGHQQGEFARDPQPSGGQSHRLAPPHPNQRDRDRDGDLAYSYSSSAHADERGEGGQGGQHGHGFGDTHRQGGEEKDSRDRQTTLERRLEEADLQARQAFEMRCALQELHVKLRERETELSRLRAIVKSQQTERPPPPSPGPKGPKTRPPSPSHKPPVSPSSSKGGGKGLGTKLGGGGGEEDASQQGVALPCASASSTAPTTKSPTAQPRGEAEGKSEAESTGKGVEKEREKDVNEEAQAKEKERADTASAAAAGAVTGDSQGVLKSSEQPASSSSSCKPPEAPEAESASSSSSSASAEVNVAVGGGNMESPPRSTLLIPPHSPGAGAGGESPGGAREGHVAAREGEKGSGVSVSSRGGGGKGKGGGSDRGSSPSPSRVSARGSPSASLEELRQRNEELTSAVAARQQRVDVLRGRMRRAGKALRSLREAALQERTARLEAEKETQRAIAAEMGQRAMEVAAHREAEDSDSETETDSEGGGSPRVQPGLSGRGGRVEGDGGDEREALRLDGKTMSKEDIKKMAKRLEELESLTDRLMSESEVLRANEEILSRDLNEKSGIIQHLLAKSVGADLEVSMGRS
eukprot:Cvel_22991.t1-p1 / transcript=Cvel_22991.t1 / gene=Cvel_22991 / organism=Chromera_velia_CCMP2878 / gene_product=hypothetical protein / transcript_product=hypothetical protein / location=Cvel_scaffold2319:24472-30031(+) / protein_length=642 / sequence_SO=supercontig / SO=protein_coding / is_pseudo=false